MRQAIKIFSFLAIAIATAVIIIVVSIGIPLPQSVSSIEPAIAFETFPLGEPQFIDIRAEEASLSRLTERERDDQLRDWLLLTIVSDTGISAEQANQSLYDLSTIRYGYMKPVSNFEYGETRSLYVGNGNVIALIPVGFSDERRKAALAHIADKHRQNLGTIPTSLVVFEYEINAEHQAALLSKREILNAKALFTANYDYHESEISDLKTLQQFMQQVNDVTLAQVDGTHLTLGGRKLTDDPNQAIAVEDIAAIWQADRNIQAQLANFESRWQTRLSTASTSQYDTIRQEAAAEFKRLKLVAGTGFSLDPTYDYRGLKALLDQAAPGLLKLQSGNTVAVTQFEVEQAQQGLAQNNEGPYLELLDKLQKLLAQNQLQGGPGTTDQEAQAVNAFLKPPKTSSFQSARYDGDLQGTEVGMVLFYTDLLAKLWALDYLDSTPTQEIVDFKPLVELSATISSIYQKEVDELRNTRLWFGPQDRGFQVLEGGKSIAFAHNSTRVYAASSNPFKPGVETEAAANSAAFLGWWNDHYEEIARFEPQYERLNQIMKWSLIVSWLGDQKQSDRLSFLQSVPVKHDNWFPSWAKANRDRLKFQQWERVPFLERGYQGTTTETMPLLESRDYNSFGQTRFFKGGVSLGDQDLFAKRAALPANSDLDEAVFRANVDYKSINVNGNTQKLTTYDNTLYELVNTDPSNDPSVASLTAKARDTAKLRTPESEIVNAQVTRTLRKEGDRLQIDTSIGGVEIGNFSTTHQDGSIITSWQSRTMDAGQSLAMELSQAPIQDVRQVFANDPMVSAAFQLNDNSGYFVRLKNSSQWLELSSGGGGSANIPPDWLARVGMPGDPPGKSFLVRFVDNASVQQKLKDGIAIIVYDNPALPKIINDEAFQRGLKNGKYDAIAQEIVDHPQQVWERRNQAMESQLQQVDDAWRTGHYAQAESLLDALILEYGKQPELVLRKADILVERRRLNVTRIQPGQTDISPAQSRRVFHDEVYSLLQNTDGKAKFKRVRTRDDAFVYVQDSPGLNNVDWSAPIDETVPLVSEARAYRVEPGSIGDLGLGEGGAGDNPPPGGSPPSGGDTTPPGNPNQPSNSRFRSINTSNSLNSTSLVPVCATEEPDASDHADDHDSSKPSADDLNELESCQDEQAAQQREVYFVFDKNDVEKL